MWLTLSLHWFRQLDPRKDHTDVSFTMYLEIPITQDVIPNELNSAECQNDDSCFCPSDLSVRDRRQKDKEERLSLLLWRRPVTTLHYFLLETLIKLKELTLK